MALPPEDQASLRQWNAAHPYEDQYNTVTGKKIPGSAKPQPAPAASKPASQASGGGSASKSTAKASGGGSTAAKTTATKTPSIDPNELANKYGLTKALMDSSPELKSLINQAVAGGWDTSMFQARLQNTNWYKSMTDTRRKMIVMQTQDPATYWRLWSQSYDHVQNLAAQMGANPDDSAMLDPIAAQLFFEGWTDERIRTELGMHIQFGNAGLAHGQAGAIQNSINSYSYAMGVQNSDQWTRDQIMKVMSGKATEQDVKNEVMQQAIASFPQYTDQIKGGMTVADLAAPYTQSMSQILEIAPGQINLFDPTIRKTMSYRDPAGTGAAKPLWQFQNELREDERWKKTQNAQDSIMGTAKSILQTFGKLGV